VGIEGELTFGRHVGGVVGEMVYEVLGELEKSERGGAGVGVRTNLDGGLIVENFGVLDWL
jgi:hypothetical protein